MSAELTGYEAAAERLRLGEQGAHRVQQMLQAAADAKKARARWLRERAAEHRDHAANLDANASDLLQEAANLERIIDAGGASDFSSALSREKATPLFNLSGLPL